MHIYIQYVRQLYLFLTEAPGMIPQGIIKKTAVHNCTFVGDNSNIQNVRQFSLWGTSSLQMSDEP